MNNYFLFILGSTGALLPELFYFREALRKTQGFSGLFCIVVTITILFVGVATLGLITEPKDAAAALGCGAGLRHIVGKIPNAVPRQTRRKRVEKPPPPKPINR